MSLFAHSADDIHQFRNLLALPRLVPGGNGLFDTRRNMIAQYFFLRAAQGRSYCRNLRHHINAITIIVDHSGNAPDLAFDATEPFYGRRLDVLAHASYIPLQGIRNKRVL
jgi:hypothetical protein